MARINVFTKLATAAFALAALSTTPTFAVENASWGALKKTLDTEALQPAAKRVTPHKTEVETLPTTEAEVGVNTLSALVEANLGGKFVIDKDGYIFTKFEIQAGALDEDTQIDMTVSGTSLDDLVVAFAPAGLTFNIPAQLTIKVAVNKVEVLPESFMVKHIHGDGTVEEAVVGKYGLERSGLYYKFVIEVPGFSRYSMGGGY